MTAAVIMQTSLDSAGPDASKLVGTWLRTAGNIKENEGQIMIWPRDIRNIVFDKVQLKNPVKPEKS